jgi:hypothetical protein
MLAEHKSEIFEQVDSMNENDYNKMLKDTPYSSKEDVYSIIGIDPERYIDEDDDT